MHVLYPPSPDRTQPLNISRVEKARILVSDDQHDILTALTLLLKLNGFRTETVDSPSQAIELVKAGRFDLILMDLNYTRDTTSGKEGLDLLRGLREAGPCSTDCCNDSLGECSSCGRSHAAGGVGFRSETMG